MTGLRPMEFLEVDPASTGASVDVGVEPTTGAASVRIAIPLTPGRDGFGPSLSLVHGGHDPMSPFAHGWSLAGLPSIDLDLRDGLPAYDGTERFRYQGQDLIPLDHATRPTSWTRDGHDVRVFRARVETVAIRAERWTEQASGRIHWRVRLPDGSVQVFGRRSDDESRIADPAEPRRTYRWLFEAGFDRLGNAMLVRWAPEDAVGVASASHDATRFADATANRYPKRILYGNAAPYAEDDDTSSATWLFESVFDYGDHDASEPEPTASNPWPVRADVGFTGRPGFEVRTRRLCRRVLLFHHFPSELGEASTLVGSLELDLDEDAQASTLEAVRYVGCRTESSSRVSRETPWATIAYTSAGTEDAAALVRVPLLGAQTQLVDLFGEGLPGLLSLEASGARFARNLGDGVFGAHEVLPAWPSGVPGATLADFDGDGNVELVQPTGPNAGYYRLDRRTKQWDALRRFDATLSLDPSQGSVRQADLSGDGRADVVLFHEAGITWFPNRGATGFGEPVEVRLPAERLPAANLPLDRFLADMTGDGLADIVEVLNGSVRYWPSLGRGRFGDPVVMDDAPRLDAQGCFDAARVVLVDLTGAGGADLLYLRGDGVVLRAANHSGIAFGPAAPIAWGAAIPNGVAPQLTDLYGDGSRCLVWPTPAIGGWAFHALRLGTSPGARQVASVTHPLGATSTIEWGHSVRHYLRDVASGRGWDTPLPAQRPVVDVLRRAEPIDGQEQSEQFVYRDGHYDPRERTFALFAIVERFDIDTRAGPVTVLPLLTRRFAHTGEFDYSSRFDQHHYSGDLMARPPPVSVVEDEGLLDVDHEDALRALLGAVVREETFAADEDGVQAEHPFQISASSQSIRLTRVADPRYRTGVQLVPRDKLEVLYEEDGADPRESLQRALEIDEYLAPLVTLEAGLPRRTALVEYDEQEVTLATASENTVVHVDEEERYELAIATEVRSCELHVPDAEDLFDATFATDLATALGSANAYDEPLDPEGTTLAARELAHERTYYWNDTQTAALSLGQVGVVTLPHHSEQAAYDRGQLEDVFDTRIDPDTDLPDFGFVIETDVFYAKGPITSFADASHFHRLTTSEAYDGGTQTIAADAHDLVMVEITDEVGNASSADIDYHLLAPWRITDPNGTAREIDYDPLGVARRTSRYGSAMDETSSIVDHGFTALTLGAALPSFADALDDPEAELGEAETLLLYEFPTGGAPMRVLSLSAEELVDRGPGGTSKPARAQVNLSYLDGFGRSLQQRTLVEPGVAWTDDGMGGLEEESVANRWLVTGFIEYDAKQQVLGTYEPFFREGHAYESALARRQFGVATTAVYDALGRAIEQHFPNDTFTETRFAAWSEITFDPNDTSDRAADYIDARDTLPTTDPERMALDQALAHADTPITRHLDALGRPIATVEVIESSAELTEKAVLDIRGLSGATIDRRDLTVSTRAYDRLGRQLFESSADAGEVRALFDAAGREVLRWREDTKEARTYDLAGRLAELEVTHDSTTWLAERYTYGEGLTGAADRNQLGRLVLTEDAAGTLETTRYGAFGEALEVERTLTATPGLEPDWSGSVSLESSAHQSRSVFDALGRRARAWLPDGTERLEEYLRSGPVGELSIITPDTTTRTILASAEYNARGQPTFVELGNGVEITNTYDDETFRLYRRHAVVPSTSTYQDLRHHYDPVGNLVYLDDLAQSPTADHVIDGLTVGAHRVFTYDTRYQLKSATGRVHEALTQPDFRGDTPVSGSFRGTRRLNINDGGDVKRYLREFTYDDAGNLTEWQHLSEPGEASTTEWTEEKWVSSTSNRSYPAKDLNGITISDPASKFNARGQIAELPSVREMVWNGRDQLRRVVLIDRPSDPDDDEVYDYGADGARVRKTTRRLVAGNVETTETVYLDGCELRRITQTTTVILERWSAHAEAGDDRLATIYFWDTDALERETDDVDAVREHYHLGTSLGSVSLEVDGAGALLAYEEYFPYGRTAFLAGDAVIEIQFRTRRFVGKDQDDATGFYVFHFRYYAPFIGNWVSPDPAGEVDGPNRYWYARNNPATLVDPDGLQATLDYDAFEVFAGGRGWRIAGTDEWVRPGDAAPLPFDRPQPYMSVEDFLREAGNSADRDTATSADTPREFAPQTPSAEEVEERTTALSERLARLTSDISPTGGPDLNDPERQARQEANARALAGDTGSDLQATRPPTLVTPSGGTEAGAAGADSSARAAENAIISEWLRPERSAGQGTHDAQPTAQTASALPNLSGVSPCNQNCHAAATENPFERSGSYGAPQWNPSPQEEAGLLIIGGLGALALAGIILVGTGGLGTPVAGGLAGGGTASLSTGLGLVGLMGGGTSTVVVSSIGLGLNASDQIDDSQLASINDATEQASLLFDPGTRLLAGSFLLMGAPAGVEAEDAVEAAALAQFILHLGEAGIALAGSPRVASSPGGVSTPAVETSEFIGPRLGADTQAITSEEYAFAILNRYQRYAEEAHADVALRVQRRALRGLPTSRRTQGAWIDAAARARLRRFMVRDWGGEGLQHGVQVNRRMYDPLGSGAYRIPDLRTPGQHVFDLTIGYKDLATPQVADIFRFGARAVTIVRPLAEGGSYGIVR